MQRPETRVVAAGVMDLGREQVTHVHCPPAMWSESSNESAVILEQLAGRVPGWRVRRYTLHRRGLSTALDLESGTMTLAMNALF